MAGPKTKVKAMKPGESNNNKKKKMPRSARAGLQFPVGRIHRFLKERSAGSMQVSGVRGVNEPCQSFSFFY